MTTSSVSLATGAAAAAASKLSEAQSMLSSAAQATAGTVSHVAESAISAAQNAPAAVKDAAAAVGSKAGSSLAAVAQAPSAVYNAAANTVSAVGGAATGALSVAGGAASSALSAVGGAVPKVLIGLDHVADLVPFGGTAVNILDLGLKHLVVKDMDPNSSQFKEYIEHLQKKQTGECLLYSVPFVGTVAKLGSVAWNYFGAKKPEAEGAGALPPYSEDMTLGGARLDERLLAGYTPDDVHELHRDPLELVAGGASAAATVNPYMFPQDNAQRL